MVQVYFYFCAFFPTSLLATLTKNIVVIGEFIKETLCKSIFIMSGAECFKYSFSLQI